MARRTTLLYDCDVPIQGGIVAYKCGQSVLMPEAHFSYALTKGAVRNGDAEPGTASGKAETHSGRTKKGDARRS